MASLERGIGIYFDGLTSARRSVLVELGDEVLSLRDSDSIILADWPYEEMRQLPAPKGLLRLGLRDRSTLARLEIRDPAFAAMIDDHAQSIDQSGAGARRSHLQVIGLTLAAAISLVLIAVLVVPALASRLAPIIPLGLENRLGAVVDARVRGMLDNGNLGDRLTCGREASEQPGQAALDSLAGRLSRSADLPIVPRVLVIRRAEANAIALPGGHIYVYQGLLDNAQSADELAGVIAHEMGHVAHRDGTRSMLQAAGLSLLFGTLLGDFVGGSAVVIAAKAVIESSYSRKVEMAADTFSVGVMQRSGGDARALAALLTRTAGDTRPGMRLWLDHPQVQDRVRNIDLLAAKQAAPATLKPAPLLTPEQWAALKQICKEF